LLDLFGLSPTRDMQGRPLAGTVAEDSPVRQAGLFGIFGSHVSVTDGRYVYMRGSARPDNTPLSEHTLMPAHMRALFSPQELASAELAPPFSFTKGAPVLKIPAWAMGTPWSYGTLLYDLETDPGQERPLNDPELELRMASMLVGLMRGSDAPPEQYERLGLPVEGEVGREHLLIESQWLQVQEGQRPALRASDFPNGARVATMTVAELMKTPARELVEGALPRPANDLFAFILAGKTLVEIAANHPDLTRERLEQIERELADIE
jgi:hypothetical protein